MKPHRIRMTHNLLLNYGLYRSMEIYVSSMSFSFVFFYCRSPLIKSALLSQRPHKANNDDMTKYHSDDYIRFLKSIRPDNMSEHSKQMQRCECGPPGLTSEASLVRVQHPTPLFVSLLTVNVGEDCPVFDGLFEFCQLSAGGSVGRSSITPATPNSP